MKTVNIFLTAFAFILLISVSLSQSYSVATSPPSINLGVLKKGERKIISFSLLTPSTKPLLVSLETGRGNSDILKNRGLLQNSSEEDSSRWITFLENPVEVPPATGGIRGKKKVSLVLQIPENAEPGYHALLIYPVPRISGTVGGTVGTVVVGIAPVVITFRVEGIAIREGKILDLTGGNDGSRNFLDVHFLNTGTTTISARIVSAEIYTQDTLVANLSSGNRLFKPNEKNSLRVYLPSNIRYGEYEVRVKVDYLTGYATKTETVKFMPAVKVVKVAYKPLPSFIFIALFIIVIIIAVWYYRREGEEE